MSKSKKLSAAGITISIVGALFFVELVSGFLQGYYIPIIPDMVRWLHLNGAGVDDANFNVFEGMQLLVAAIVVPIMAKLGDMYGHKKILLISAIATAAATWALIWANSFWMFLIAWSLQGFLTVWLPLEIALIFDKARRSDIAASATRKAAAWLIVGLESGAIIGALAAGRLFKAFGGGILEGEDIQTNAAEIGARLDGSIPLTLIVPAVMVTAVIFVIWFAVPESQPSSGRSLDWVGFSILTIALLLITSGLSLLKPDLHEGAAAPFWVYAVIIIGVLTLIPFAKWTGKQEDPAIDLKVMKRPTLWPVLACAGLIGISLLGAQAPMSTYAGTVHPDYGLGLDSSSISNLIGVYLISMIIGAIIFPSLSKWFTPRFAMVIGAALVFIGYGMLLPFHLTVLQVMINMATLGAGAGILMGAMPSAAAAAAPKEQTGIATGLTNTTKTIGGAFASAMFAVVLTIGTVQGASQIIAPLAGYMWVWGICAGGALLAALLLLASPKDAFSDAPDVEADAESSDFKVVN